MQQLIPSSGPGLSDRITQGMFSSSVLGHGLSGSPLGRRRLNRSRAWTERLLGSVISSVHQYAVRRGRDQGPGHCSIANLPLPRNHSPSSCTSHPGSASPPVQTAIRKTSSRASSLNLAKAHLRVLLPSSSSPLQVDGTPAGARYQ